MARAIITGYRIGFANQPEIFDDGTNGWGAHFTFSLFGNGVPGGFVNESVEVHFSDNDTEQQMKDKKRTAVRNKAAQMGVVGANGMMVIDSSAPTKL